MEDKLNLQGLQDSLQIIRGGCFFFLFFKKKKIFRMIR